MLVKKMNTNIVVLTGCSSRHPVWAAVRASTAAPGYFDDFYLDGMIHQDGGIMANNATHIAIHEAQKIWPNYRLQCVISLGLGRTHTSLQTSAPPKISNKRALSITEKFSRIVDSATDTVRETFKGMRFLHIRRNQ